MVNIINKGAIVLAIVLAAGCTSSKWDKAGADSKAAVNSVGEAATDSTKQGWDKTKEGSEQAWDKTKEGTQQGWDKTKDSSEEAWDKTKNVTKEIVE